MPLIVVLDTNFLTVPTQFGVDIFTEAQRVLERKTRFIVLNSVIGELQQKLAGAKGAEGAKFKVALDLVNRCDIHDYEGDAVSVDDQILDYSRSAKAIVATNDRELRQRATAQGLPVLYMRSKKRLDLDGSLI